MSRAKWAIETAVAHGVSCGMVTQQGNTFLEIKMPENLSVLS